MTIGQQWRQDTLPGFENYRGGTIPDTSSKTPESRLPAHTVMSMLMPSDVLKHAISEGRFKNTYEEGATHVNWRDADPEDTISIPEGLGGSRTIGLQGYKDSRKRAEKDLFDIPEEAPGENRPIYGFLRDSSFDKDERPTYHHPLGLLHEHHGLGYYGNALVDFKEPTKDANITSTPGDSLNTYSDYHENMKMAERIAHHAISGNWDIVSSLYGPDHSELKEAVRNGVSKEDLTSHLFDESMEMSPKTYISEFLTPRQVSPHSLDSEPPTPGDYHEVQFHDRPDPSKDIAMVHVGAHNVHNMDDSRIGRDGGASVEADKAELEDKVKSVRESGYKGPITTWRSSKTYQPSLFEGAEGPEAPTSDMYFKDPEDYQRKMSALREFNKLQTGQMSERAVKQVIHG